MTPIKILLFSLLFLILFCGCALIAPEMAHQDKVDTTDYVDEIFINEVSGDNSSEDDWVEFYNSTSDSVDLGGLYLSDDADDLYKWQITAGIGMTSYSHVVITCDGSGEGNNASFKLAAGVDGVYLTSSGGSTIIDSLTTVPTTGEGSYGRLTDGASSWSYFASPTKGEDN